MGLRYWNGSNWTTVLEGGGVKYWNGSAWVSPQFVRYWNGSTWVNVWTKSNPATYTFYPSLTTNIRFTGSGAEYNSNNTSSNDRLSTLGLGSYSGTRPYQYTSILKFDSDAIGTSWSLAEYMIDRPVVKSASLRLYRMNGVGLQSPAGYLRMGAWSQLNAQDLPATTVDGTYHDWDPQTVTDITGWQRGANKTFPVNAQNIYDLRDGKCLMFSEVTSGYQSSSGTTSAHSQIYGLNDGSYDTSIVPLLTVTLDLI